jgi:O-acetyl-ADP-ribose deacetylase
MCSGNSNPATDTSPSSPFIEVVQGDLLDQEVEVIVNAWNRNIIPWWLLLPQGVSGAIKKRGGTQPFRELARHGPIPLGQAVLTSAGKLPFRGIIHVAGINMLWQASETSIRQSVQSAMAIVEREAFTSVAFPLIGAGSGSFRETRALEIILEELEKIETHARVVVVQYQRRQ